jgi:phosphate transport system substrate-binding protein
MTRLHLVRLAVFAFAFIYVCPENAVVQPTRDKTVQTQGAKVYYTKKFDLSGLPPYKPEQKVTGNIRQWGNNYIVNLVRVWEEGFGKFHPEVKFEDHLKTSEAAIPGLYTHVADIGLLGRQIMWDELLAYQREFNGPPMEITVCTGSFNAETFALGVFVHKDNPISQLTMEQLDGIFGAERSGGWNGLVWDTSVARGPEKNIRTWGQLGLKGEWADKPIHVYGYNLNYHFVDEFNKKVFHGGKKWNERLREYANYRNSEGRMIDSHEQFLADLGKDPYGIAYGLMDLTPQTKAVALAVKEGGPYVELNLDNVQNRTYPLIRDIYFYLNREKGKPTDPKLKEFLRYILSREGQEAVMRDGKFLPLTAEAVREQLKKLE